MISTEYYPVTVSDIQWLADGRGAPRLIPMIPMMIARMVSYIM